MAAGDPVSTQVVGWYQARNIAGSAKLYTVDPGDFLRADRQAQSEGCEIVGVVHSHTHSDPYPSPTDIEQAPDPSWHYMIISLRHPDPTVRSYSISGAQVQEEPVILVD